MYLYSYSQDENGVLKEKATDLYTHIETTIVNGELPLHFRRPNEKKTGDLKQSIEKLYRDKYKNYQTKFFEDLKGLALAMKDIPMGPERKKALVKKMINMNVWMDKKLRSEVFDIETGYKVKF